MIFKFCALLVLFFFGFLSASPLIPEEENGSFRPSWILYIAQKDELDRAIELYRAKQAQTGVHDDELLRQLARLVLEQECKKTAPKEMLAAIWGAILSQMPDLILKIGEHSIQADGFAAQAMAAVGLASLNSTEGNLILEKAFINASVPMKLELAILFTRQQSAQAFRMLSLLIDQTVPSYHFLFPPLLAMLDYPEATKRLQAFTLSPFLENRLAAISGIVDGCHDELLPTLRAMASHNNVAEQEACVYALGQFQDQLSLPRLKQLSQSAHTHVKLCALLALIGMGDAEAKGQLLSMNTPSDPFWLLALSKLEEGAERLYAFLKDKDQQIRFLATLGLLERKDPRALEGLGEFLLRKNNELGFVPQRSPGAVFCSWRVIPSASHQPMNALCDLRVLAMHVREHLVHLCLELPEKDFIAVCRKIFHSGQLDLVNIAIQGLENIGSVAAKELLWEQTAVHKPIALRLAASLSLLRLKEIKGDNEALGKVLYQWLASHKTTDILHLQDDLPRELRVAPAKYNPFALTPVIEGQLLMACYGTLADMHSPQAIDILLDALYQGEKGNRAILAGLLLHTLN